MSDVVSAISFEDLLAQVIEITACDPEIGQHFLSVCDNNVEAAVALYYEQEGVPIDINSLLAADNPGTSTGSREAGTASAATAHNSTVDPSPLTDDNENVNEDDSVRPPIAPIRERLIGPNDTDLFFNGRPHHHRQTYYRPTQGVKVCPLRDFAREAALMEEQLNAAANATDENASVPSTTSTNGSSGLNSRQRRAAQMVNSAVTAGTSRESRLVDLFRPPTDIIYASPFQMARKHATSLSMWLLVNIQSDNFSSQVLNRDVWSDKKFRSLIRSNFIFWQVIHDSLEGRRFAAFYKCETFPYVCIIDPQTGEEVLKINDPKQSNILTSLKKFIAQHRPEIDDEKPTTSKRSMPILIDDDEEDSVKINDDDDDDIVDTTDLMNSCESVDPRPSKRAKLMELSEEEQIAMAIRNSMNESGKDAVANNNNIHNNNNNTNSSSTRKYKNGNRLIIDDLDDSDDHEDQNGLSTNKVNIDDDDDEDSTDFTKINNKRKMTNKETKSETVNPDYEKLLGKSEELSMIKMRLLNSNGEEEVIHLKWPSDTSCKTLRSYVCQVHPHIFIKDKAFKIICAFPRKTIDDGEEKSLKEMGFHPSAYLHVTLD